MARSVTCRVERHVYGCLPGSETCGVGAQEEQTCTSAALHPLATPAISLPSAYGPSTRLGRVQ